VIRISESASLFKVLLKAQGAVRCAHGGSMAAARRLADVLGGRIDMRYARLRATGYRSDVCLQCMYQCLHVKYQVYICIYIYAVPVSDACICSIYVIC
jgi:hypothetical protein